MIKQDSFILVWMEGLGIKNSINSKSDIIFENLDLRVDSGEYIAISGMYGTDKVNFMSVLGCIDRPSSGKYIFDYNDVTTIQSEKLDEVRSKSIGFIFKGLNVIDNISVYKNIELPLVSYGSGNNDAVVKTAQRLDISESLGKKAKELSDFERQKVAIARALVTNPLLIIADEPGAGISKEERSRIMDIISEINREGIAVIVFSEEDDVTGRVSRNIVFDKGRIKSDSGFDSCKSREGAV